MPMTIYGVTVDRLEDGKIVAAWPNVDVLELRLAIGVVTTAPCRRMTDGVLRVALVAAAVALPAVPADFQAVRQPIVTVIRHGGLCPTRRERRQVVRIGDSTISGKGYVSRRLTRSARAELLRAIAKLDTAYLRAHPFTGTCPTASDGAESIYRFRGFARAFGSCTYDLRGVQAVRLTDRLLATLKRR
jgi:hypothetical protein